MKSTHQNMLLSNFNSCSACVTFRAQALNQTQKKVGRHTSIYTAMHSHMITHIHDRTNQEKKQLHQKTDKNMYVYTNMYNRKESIRNILDS